MHEQLSIKTQLCLQLSNLLEERIRESTVAIAAAKESRNTETKSSAGDKYETGREMIQIEIDKNEAQLNKTRILKHELSKINILKTYQKVEFGCLVITNQENYFISVALGKLVVAEHTYYAISLASPIGQLLAGKSKGDCIQFLGKKICIEDLL